MATYHPVFPEDRSVHVTLYQAAHCLNAAVCSTHKHITGNVQGGTILLLSSAHNYHVPHFFFW